MNTFIHSKGSFVRLGQIHYLETTNKLDLTGKQQHDFKKSTATAGALLQSMISRAADENCYVVMASLDLSMPFDLVNVELLIKRLKIMGMPADWIKLIRGWLTGRSFYVQVGVINHEITKYKMDRYQGKALRSIPAKCRLLSTLVTLL